MASESSDIVPADMVDATDVDGNDARLQDQIIDLDMISVGSFIER